MAMMTKGERQELGSLIRKRERVMKAQAHERSAALLAEFDAHLAKIYRPADDPVWQQLKAESDLAIAKAREGIAERCRQLGIPEDFAPDLYCGWVGRGHNADEARTRELRRAAKSRIEAMETEAVSKIERLSLEAQTSIVASGLESDGAKEFLSGLGTVETLMPRLPLEDVETLVDTKRADREFRRQSYLN